MVPVLYMKEVYTCTCRCTDQEAFEVATEESERVGIFKDYLKSIKVCVCVCACVRACVCACVHACACAWVGG